MPTYYTIVTNAGRQKLMDAALAGTPVQVTHIAVGTAFNVQPEPSPEMTELVQEIHRAPVNSVSSVPGANGRIQADAQIPAEIGGFTIREIGLFLADGTLLAYGSTPPTYKPEMPEGATSFMVVRMVVDLHSEAGVALQIQAVSGFASQDWALDTFAAKRAPQVTITSDTVLTAEHDGKVLFVVAEDPVLLSTAQELPNGWTAVVVLVSGPRVRIDAGNNPLLEDGYNVITRKGAGATLTETNVGGHDFWLAGGLTERREDLMLASGSPLSLGAGTTLEITGETP